MVSVGSGGTGATTLASGGYLKGAGTSAITSQSGIPAGDITSGILPIARGGTGNSIGPGSERILASSFTAQTSVSVNTVFSSTFQNYQILINITASSTAELRMRYRSGTTDNTSSNYRQGFMYVGNVVSQAFGSGNNILDTSQNLGDTNSTAGSSVEIFSFAPNQTAVTKTLTRLSGSNAFVGSGALTVTTAYNGFTIFPSTGTITGTIRVYGMRN
jgi:hypothetical protein